MTDILDEPQTIDTTTEPPAMSLLVSTAREPFHVKHVDRPDTRIRIDFGDAVLFIDEKHVTALVQALLEAAVSP